MPAGCWITSGLTGYLATTVISVAPSPMGGLFATGSGDMRARIWRSVLCKLVPSVIELTYVSLAVTDHIVGKEERVQG